MTNSATTKAQTVMDLSIEPWHAINDEVMGGLSSGTMVSSDEGLCFKGVLSLRNNGGFSSVRRTVSEDFSDSRGIRLTIKGDGRRYQLRLRQDQNFDGIAWRHEFSTDGSLQVIELPYPEFEAVVRGRIIKDAGAINPAMIRQIGFLIADKIEGRFSLSVLKMEILKNADARNDWR
jgi:monofunctional biosynthetic peptidoglycan transglycosylase